MRRSHFHPAACKVCGKPEDEVGAISQKGFCLLHSLERFEANYDAMKTKRGPFAQWWAFKMAASVGLAPLDESPPRP